jgi:hypothetical protein
MLGAYELAFNRLTGVQCVWLRQVGYVKWKVATMAHKHTRHHKKREHPTWPTGQPVRTGYSTPSPKARQVLRLNATVAKLSEAAQAAGRPFVDHLDLCILPGWSEW